MIKRIPLEGGLEYDALSRGGKRVHNFRPGERKFAKRGYWRRFRQMMRNLLRKDAE